MGEYQKSQQRIKDIIYKEYKKKEELRIIQDEVNFLERKSGDKRFQENQKVNDYLVHLEHMLRNAEKKNIDLEIGK